MTTQRFTRSRTSVTNISYHLIWCPKYRRRVLINKVEIRLKYLLLKKAKENEWDIVTMEIMPDHIHIFIRVNPKISLCKIVHHLKGYSSYILRKEFPVLKYTLPSLWTRSYYCESVGHISETTVKKYIREQKEK